MRPLLSAKQVFTILALGVAALAAAPGFAQQAGPAQVLHMGIGVNDIGNLDPQISTAVGDTAIVELVYEGLTRFPDGAIDSTHILPSLATSWKVQPDGLTWTFNLRKGVQWQGGYGEFTADDVLFSYNRLKDPKAGSPFRANLESIKSMKKIDAHTVQFVTARPVPNLPALFVNANHAFILSKAASEKGVDFRSHPVGTGPFQYQGYKPRESVTFARNDAYWGGRPILEQVVMQFMPDNGTRELALRNGDVQAIDIAATQQAIDRMRRAKMDVDLTAPANSFMVYFNPAIKPFDNIKVRQALSYATDRNSMLTFLGKDVSRKETSPLPVGYTGHTEDVAHYDFDLAKAKKLLAEAGFPNGFDASLPISNNNIYLQPMQIIQAQWRKIGVNLKLNVVDHPTYHRLIRQNISPAVIYGAYRYPLDGIRYLDEFFYSKSSIGTPTAVTNFSHYNKIDTELDSAREERDPAKQIQQWQQAQKQIMADAIAIPLFTRKYALARSPKLDLGHKQVSYSFYTLSKDTRLLP
jgi:peptide/nickel transport system substrate-binding protein